jgi:hypothetical protein
MNLEGVADCKLVYTHCAKLEKASPKFTHPGDFFTYVVFVMVTSLVSRHSIFVCSFPFFHTSHYLPA